MLCHLSYSPKRMITGAGGARTRNLVGVNDVVPSAFAALAIQLSNALSARKPRRRGLAKRPLYQLSYSPTTLRKWNWRDSNPRHVVSPAFVAIFTCRQQVTSIGQTFLSYGLGGRLASNQRLLLRDALPCSLLGIHAAASLVNHGDKDWRESDPWGS